jgi:hypothetical protein
VSWTEKTQQAEAWGDQPQQSESWSSASEQGETWAGQRTIRVFDPYVFANNPIFDTGLAAGVWAQTTEQSEVWS